MAFQFATCDPSMALRFLRQIYPGKEVSETTIPKLMNLVKQDVLRIQDPDFHKPAQVVAGNSYVDSMRSEVNEAIEEFKVKVHNA